MIIESVIDTSQSYDYFHLNIFYKMAKEGVLTCPYLLDLFILYWNIYLL